MYSDAFIAYNPLAEICCIRAFSSLREHDVQVVQAMLVLIDGSWTIEQHTDYAGDLSLLLTEGSDATSDHTFLLHRTIDGIHLVDVADEAYQHLGTFKQIGEALWKVRRHTTLIVGVEMHCPA